MMTTLGIERHIPSASRAPGEQLPQTDLARVQSSSTLGTNDDECRTHGGADDNATAYATDVVGNCSASALRCLLALALALTLTLTWTASADDCDIAVLPAATLLLPYFEVDLDDPASATTLFTITNTTHEDAIARVTLWTDRGYPVFTFNLQLTGYDVYPLNLYDVIGAGSIAQGTGPRLRSAFTTGSIAGECDAVGGVHENATGYATIDVVGNHSANTPRDRAYWRTDLRHDNILLGDYQQLEDGRAQGGPLVHIRAIEDGGRKPGVRRTFYARFTDRDGRQPLPSQFAARWTEGTSLKIWREGRAGMDATCADYAADAELAVAEVVAFDDSENAAEGGRIELAASTKTAVDDPRLPQIDGTNGWLYLNLDRSRRDDFASQAWVISSSASSDVDATALASGCAAPVERGAQIAPAAEEDDSCDIALRPAATLLLPYFEVDLQDEQGENTVFTIANVGPRDRIARVTLWTDYAFPVVTFNVFLTGYDVQTIDLFELLERGTLPQPAGRGPRSDRNFELDRSACARVVAPLAGDWIARMQQAFTQGTVPDLGSVAGCNNVGNEHDHAIGYATVDVVRNCGETSPLDEEYWTEDLGWDNVLTGESQQTNAREELAQGSPLVHVRAFPGTRFPRTFYGRLTPAGAPRLDARQPLPSTLAMRWIDGGPGAFMTLLKIWREGKTGRDTTCARWDDNFYPWTETVTFDENENAVADRPDRPQIPVPELTALPATAIVNVADASLIPQMPNGAQAGWIYMNLDDETDGRAMQAWAVSSLRADGRYPVDFDAAALGNGCSPEAAPSEHTTGTEPIGPRP